MTLQEILIRAYFVLLSLLLLLLLYAYYVRRSIARKFKHVHCKKFTAACCNVWTSYRSWSYLFATLPCDESLSCFKIVGLPLYAEAVSALFFFLCLIRHDLKPINMKNCGNFHFPTRFRKLVFFWHQSEAKTAATVWNWSGKTLSQGLFSPFFTFLRSIYIFPPV